MPVGMMDRPPMPGPPISGQMGVPPPGQQDQPGGMGTMAQQQTNPHGAILAQVEAVKRVLESMAQTEPTMAPFAQQASQALDNGVAAVNSAPRSSPDGMAPSAPSAQPSTPGAGMPAFG
jgi:hypothetical protein